MSKTSTNKFKCGMVSIVGRPNVGKSTLLNTVVGEKIAIVSKTPQTTRNQVRGIYSDTRGQIVFIDTPGLHLGKDRLDECMNNTSVQTTIDVDCVIYLVDTTRVIGPEEKRIALRLKNIKGPLILGLNKVDSKKADIPSYISHWEEVKGERVEDMKNFCLIALSGRDEINTDKLKDIIFDYLPKGPAVYPEEIVTDTPQRIAIADIVREKLFWSMKKEIPHSTSVLIEEMRPVKGKTTLIKALVMVERPSQKEIIIGKKGENLKRAGKAARLELEDLLETKVFLEMYVKVQKNWRDDITILQELGYSS